MFHCPIAEVGLDKSKFGHHSLRSNGITSGVNIDVSEGLLKAHGRWASDKAKKRIYKEQYTISNGCFIESWHMKISLISMLLRTNKPRCNCMTCILMLLFALFDKDCFAKNISESYKPNPSLISYLALYIKL